MSGCCFTRFFSCIKQRNKIRSNSLTSEHNPTQALKTSFSMSKLNSAPDQLLKNPSLTSEKLLPELPKSKSSHKSSIMIKKSQKFEQQILKKTKEDPINSLSLSKISDAYQSDSSLYDFLVDIKLIEKKREESNTHIPRPLKRTQIKVNFSGKKSRRPLPPMFLKNPCFESSSRLSSIQNNSEELH